MKKRSSYDVAIIQSPLGFLKLMASRNALCSIDFLNNNSGIHHNYPDQLRNDILDEACIQLNEYFEGKLTHFNFPVAPEGTSFQQRVWETLSTIPYGATTTYLEQSRKMGDPNTIRAVGEANGHNPIPIIIPCHRVIGVTNNLIGYAGGIERKRWLLQHEGVLLL